MAKRTGAIVGLVIAVVVFVAVALAIAMGIVNTRIESEMTASIDAAIENAGLQEVITYDSIDVDAVRGRATMNDVSFDAGAGGPVFNAGIFSVQVPPQEAIVLAQNPRSAVVTKMDVALEELSAMEPNSGMPVEVRSLQIDAEGAFSAALVGASPQDMLDNLESLSVTLERFAIVPGDAFLAQAQIGFGEMEWMADPENWQIDEITFDAITSDGALLIESMRFASPLVEMGGNADLIPSTTGALAPQRIELSVEEIEPSIRAAAAQMGTMMGVAVPPDGPFVFSFVMRADGMPEMSIE